MLYYNNLPMPGEETAADYQRALATINELDEQLTNIQRLLNTNGKPKKAALDSLPVPVRRDNRKFPVAGYSFDEWFLKIAEEVFEAHAVAKETRTYSQKNDGTIIVKRENLDRLAEELTDVITVCTSFLNAIGFDQDARAYLQRKVNQKNLMRGYMEPGEG